MGGIGSGRRGWRVTVEGCQSLKLDVNRATRDVRGRLRDVPEGEKLATGLMVWAWTAHGDATPWAHVAIMLRLDHWRGEARLIFDVDHASRRTGPQDQVVQMEATPCRYGGRRWWWLCPATGRRAVNLYLPNGGRRFLSRDAYRLAYQSQRETVTGRAWRTIRKLERRLGSAPGTPPGAMEKPRWMRWRTFDALRLKREAAEDALDADLLRSLDRLARYLPA